MELWDIITADRQPTGRKAVRGEPMNEGDHHLVVHVCIFDRAGRMLIQHRQPFKEGWPNMWDISVGGSAVAGDSSQTAAERETAEELGLKVDLTGIRPHFTVNFEKGFDDFYLIEQEVDLDSLVLQPEEVQAVKWVTCDELLAMIDDGTFIPYYKSLIRMMFDMRGRFGGLSK